MRSAPSPPPHCVNPVVRFQRAVNVSRFLRAGVTPLAVVSSAWVAWHLFVHRYCAVALSTGLFMALGFTLHSFRKGRLSFKAAAIRVDHQAAAGGLLLTALERPLGLWQERLQALLAALRHPPQPWRARVSAWAAAVALVVGGAWLTPVKPQSNQKNLAAQRALEKLHLEAAAVENEKPLSPETQSALEKLDNAMRQGEFGANQWQAADAVNETLQRQALGASTDLAAAAEAASLAASELEDSERRRELESALAKLSPQSLAANDGGLTSASAGPLTTDSSSSALPAGQAAREAAASLKALEQALERRRAALARAFPNGFGDSAQLGFGELAADAENARPAAALAKARSSRKEDADKGQPGPGGGTRSDGLKFGEENVFHSQSLGYSALPKGTGGEAGVLYGLTMADPTPGNAPQLTVSAPGVTTSDRGKALRSKTLSPSNQLRVKRYFQNKPIAQDSP